jgi:uncharacterized membrane protein
LIVAAGLGVVAGSRAMLAPALVAHARRWPLASVLQFMASGELAVDKLPSTPSRLDPLPLLGRVASGALVGALVDRRHRAAGAIVGAAAAVAAAHAFARCRTAYIGHQGTNALAGACEDTAVLALGMWLIRHGSNTLRPRGGRPLLRDLRPEHT